ncbi:MAG: CHASE domain-containing protein [Ideonella sp.]
MEAVTKRLASWGRIAATPTLRAAAIAAISVLAVGLIYDRLTTPLSYPSPLDPVAGLALVFALCNGRAGLIGVSIGALLLQLTLARLDIAGNSSVLAALGIAAGTVGQAWLGARLVERHVDQPLALTEPRDIALFFGLGGFVACSVGATAALLSLGVSQAIGFSQWLLIWLNWWTAQTLGVLLMAPIALTLLGQPRSEWAPRRTVMGISMLTLLALLTVGAVQLKHLEEARVRGGFEREAMNAAALLDLQLQRPLLALEAMHSVFVASTKLTQQEWRRATESWLQAPTHIQALGFSAYAKRSEIAELEDEARADGLPKYTVHDRVVPGSTGGAQPTGDVVAIRYIEPSASNSTALGINALSIPQARDAIERSMRSDRAAATGGFRLSQDSQASRQTGIVVYRGLFNGAPTDPSARRRAFRGVVFVTLRMDDLLAAAFASLPAELSVCIIDNARIISPVRLAGPEGCESRRYALGWDKPVAFADRNWTIRIGTSDAVLVGHDIGHNWIVSAVGIVLSAMFGALLLGMTGRARRIEAAVAERTVALVEEVREREQAEAAMRESEQRFRNIFNNVPIGVVYTNLDGQLQHVNPHFSKLTGYANDELLRMDLFDYLHADDIEVERRSTRQLLEGEIAMHRGHCRVIRKNGDLVWVQSSLTLLRDSEGHPRRLVGVMEDITEHLKLVEAEREREQAVSANLAKNEFLSRMSHELRTPLNAILGFAQLLELDDRAPLTSGQRPWVVQIQQAGWHLLDMINDVLDLSRIESGNVRLEKENLDLESLVEASVSLIEGDAAKRGIVIKRDFDAGSVAVVGDITRVKQILINLLSNAVKYNTDYGKIEISARQDATHVTLEFRDTGLGMNAAQLDALFQPFNRLGRERSNLEGTGIGLVISKRLAEWMGGSLRAESTAGVGSTFFLTLPQASAADTVRQELGAETSTPFEYHRRIVHYIEDNETNIEVMRGILACRPQVEMTVSMNGLDAIAALRREPPDIILLDMNLPDIDGMDLLRHIKSDPATAAIPVIVVSADALGVQVDIALAEGALRYLTKPVSVAELLRLLDEVLDEAISRFI